MGSGGGGIKSKEHYLKISNWQVTARLLIPASLVPNAQPVILTLFITRPRYSLPACSAGTSWKTQSWIFLVPFLTISLIYSILKCLSILGMQWSLLWKPKVAPAKWAWCPRLASLHEDVQCPWQPALQKTLPFLGAGVLTLHLVSSPSLQFTANLFLKQMLVRYQNNSPPTNDDEWKNNGVTKTWDRLMLQVRCVVLRWSKAHLNQ